MKITAAELKELLLEETAYAGECGHIVDGIHGLVKDMDPHDVSEIFQTVFAQLPGVELEYHDDPAPEGGEEAEKRQMIGFERGEEKDTVTAGRPIGFREQLMELIRQELGDQRGMPRPRPQEGEELSYFEQIAAELGLSDEEVWEYVDSVAMELTHDPSRGEKPTEADSIKAAYDKMRDAMATEGLREMIRQELGEAPAAKE